MQRAREGVLWLRGTEGILPKARAIVQNEPQKAQNEEDTKGIEEDSFTIAEPATESGVVHDDCLRTLGAGGDEADLDADLFGEKVDVTTRVGRKGTHLGHANS